MQYRKFLIVGIIILSTFNGNSTESWYSVYFTSPPNSEGKRHPLPYMCRIIDSAKKSIHGAFYSINSKEVITSLIKARSRGVEVHLVTDDSATTQDVINYLKDHKVAVEVDGKTSLMHNKFMVIDQNYVWTGSLNITDNGFVKNNNNVILIRSHELAKIYEYEFREMFEFSIFSNKQEQTKFLLPDNKYYVKIGDSSINCYFSPENDIERVLLKRILKAKKSVIFMAFSFTSDSLGDACLEVHRRGVKVSGIFEARGSASKYSEYKKLMDAGIRVIKDKNSAVMHHKVIIIDSETVITGSYNYSKNAAKRNDENILIIKDKGIAEAFTKEFIRLYE